MMDLVTYLSFDGSCESAFQHYEKVLGGKILMMVKGSDMPPDVAVPSGSANRVMHARLAVGGRLLMGGDGPPGAGKPKGFCAHIMLDDPGEAERIFRDLGEGGTITMPIAETFWARKFGIVTDRYGVPWMINCEKVTDTDARPITPFVISRTFDVARDELWKCFVDLRQLEKWWGPKGVKIFNATMDLRPGGTFHYGMRTPDGKIMWGRQVYREIEAPKRIVLVNSFSDEKGGLARHPFGPTWPIEMLTNMTFTDAGSGRSTFTVTWLPLNPTPEERATFDAGHASMTGGWTGTLEQLAAFLATA